MSLNPTKARQSDVVFILGLMHRSGTNLLQDLLVLHPLCARHAIPEDFLVAKLSCLSSFADRVIDEWNPRWTRPDSSSAIRKHLGDGLITYMRETAGNSDSETRPSLPTVVAKTPGVAGLEYFRDFFPDSPLLLVVRDGRSVVESGRRSFGWTLDEGARRWRDAVRAIIDFRDRDTNPDRTSVVRFEDLQQSRCAAIRDILRFLGLEESTYPFDAANSLAIRGSSELKSTGNSEIHWRPVAKPEGFDPLGRHSHWKSSEHARFDWIAGRELCALGYVQEERPSPDLLARTRQRLLDISRGLSPRQMRRYVGRRVRARILRHRSRPAAERKVSPELSSDHKA